jgi:hypothetical protein
LRIQIRDIAFWHGKCRAHKKLTRALVVKLRGIRDVATALRQQNRDCVHNANPIRAREIQNKRFRHWLFPALGMLAIDKRGLCIFAHKTKLLCISHLYCLGYE